LIAATGAVEWIEHMIDQRVTRALDWLDAARIDDPVRTALVGMAATCAERAA
jgi:geranylgeranyl diphosphate synthase type I